MNNYNYYNWYRNLNNNSNMFNSQNINGNYENLNILNPKEGFERGNIFSDLYSQYKNYKPVILKANNQQESKLLELQTICFAIHELNLYLDLYPNDQSILTLFNDYRSKYLNMLKDYEEKYGPLTVDSNANSNSFVWVTESWPWEVKNV